METLPPRTDYWTGDRIRTLREEKGWTQAELAERLGLTHARSVYDLEKGRRGVKVSGPVAVLLDLIEDYGELPARKDASAG